MIYLKEHIRTHTHTDKIHSRLEGKNMGYDLKGEDENNGNKIGDFSHCLDLYPNVFLMSWILVEMVNWKQLELECKDVEFKNI